MSLKGLLSRLLAGLAAFFVFSSAYSAERCEDIFSADAGIARRLWTGIAGDVLRLNLELNKKLSLYGHFVTVNAKARVVLKVAHLDAHSTEANRVLFQAIKSGRIDEVDAGMVVGPKVLPLLLSLAHLTPSDKKMIVRGTIRPSWIHDTLLREEPLFDSQGRRNYNHFTSKDIERWQKAADELGLLEACRKFFGAGNLSACGNLDFTLDARFPDRVTWNLAP